MNKREIKEIVEMYNYIISNNLSEKIKTIRIYCFTGNNWENDPYYDSISKELAESGYSKYFGISGGMTRAFINGVSYSDPYLRDLELLKVFKSGNLEKLKKILNGMVIGQ